MTKVSIYEKEGKLRAIVETNGRVSNIVVGLEHSRIPAEDFISVAQYGFLYSERYECSDYNGLPMQDAADAIRSTESLIAEISDEEVNVFYDAMGAAGRKLFALALAA